MATRKIKQEVIESEFPSLLGAEEVEIAKRSQDVEAVESSVHQKVFVVLAREFYDTEEFHENNIFAMRQALINQGLRPDEKGRFVGAEDHEDGASVNLTYEVDVTPAIVATGEVAHAHVVTDEN